MTAELTELTELTELSELTAELNAVVAELPPERVRQVLNFARILKHSPTGEIDMSDPTPEDLRTESNRIMQRFEQETPDEEWGDLKPMKPGERYK